jgi:hypothetical protein
MQSRVRLTRAEQFVVREQVVVGDVDGRSAGRSSGRGPAVVPGGHPILGHECVMEVAAVSEPKVDGSAPDPGSTHAKQRRAIQDKFKLRTSYCLPSARTAKEVGPVQTHLEEGMRFIRLVDGAFCYVLTPER